MKLSDESNSCKNENHSHNKSTQYAPKQNFVLVLNGHMKVGENQNEYE